MARPFHRATMSANQPFEIHAASDDGTTELNISRAGLSRRYRIEGGTHHDYLEFYRRLAQDFGTRSPHVYEGPAPSEGPEPDWRPLILENLSPRTFAGYGDPAVL